MGKLSPKKLQERPLGQGIFSPSNAIKGLGKRSNYVDEHEESLGSIFSSRWQNPECGIRPWFEFRLKISWTIVKYWLFGGMKCSLCFRYYFDLLKGNMNALISCLVTWHQQVLVFFGTWLILNQGWNRSLRQISTTFYAHFRKGPPIFFQSSSNLIFSISCIWTCIVINFIRSL